MIRFSTLLRAMPLDAAGWRAVDEVVADWRYEASHARSARERAWLAVRAAWALGVAVVLVTARDAGMSMRHVTMAGVGMCLLIFTGVVWFTLYVSPPAFASQLPPGVWEGIRPGWVADWVGWLVPFAFFAGVLVGGGWTRHRVPVLGVAVWAFCFTALVDGWLLPIVDPQAPGFRRTLAGGLSFHELVSMGNPTLSSAILNPRPHALPALSQLNETLARGICSGALVLLAGELVGRRTLLQLLAGAVVFGIICVVGFDTMSFPAFPRAWRDQVMPFDERLLRAWAVPSAIMIVFATMALQRSTRRSG